jgi:hypothetical protein
MVADTGSPPPPGRSTEEGSMRRPAAAALAALLLLALLPATVAAVPIPGDLDQSNESYTSLIFVGIGQVTAETITAGKTGLLTHVELYLDDGLFGSGGTASVEIWPTSGGFPAGSALASGTATVPAESGAAWYDVVFTDPPAVTAGTVYAIVLTSANAPTYVPAGETYPIAWGINTSGYAGGAAVSLLPDGWTAPGWDYMFRTYVVPLDASLQWSATSIVAGASTPLTLTETFTFAASLSPNAASGAAPNAISAYIVQGALPSWFTVTGATCSSQVVTACDPTAFVAGAQFVVYPDGNPVVVTLTGIAAPPVSAAGTNGTASGQDCVGGTTHCYSNSATIGIVAPAASPSIPASPSASAPAVTPPPTATAEGEGSGWGSGGRLILAGCIAALAVAFAAMRRERLLRR